MSLYNLIQAKIFSTYEDWCLKSSSMNRHGFHIVGIENELKSMQDGRNMFVELCPPHAVEGCTSMKAVGGKAADQADLLLEIDGKKYRRAGISYDDAARIMKDFVQKRVRPAAREYEPMEDDSKAIADAFAALADILLETPRIRRASGRRCRRKARRALMSGGKDSAKNSWAAAGQSRSIGRAGRRTLWLP